MRFVGSGQKRPSKGEHNRLDHYPSRHRIFARDALARISQRALGSLRRKDSCKALFNIHAVQVSEQGKLLTKDRAEFP